MLVFPSYKIVFPYILTFWLYRSTRASNIGYCLLVNHWNTSVLICLNDCHSKISDEARAFVSPRTMVAQDSLDLSKCCNDKCRATMCIAAATGSRDHRVPGEFPSAFLLRCHAFISVVTVRTM
ncbi:hypothetical protein EV421DRAFT_58395 [Armillaria borealis]|uniref:Uncharacterized protein n=1 Tax=Armillaria borealis TaxID=47425 RepID=A0AA39K8B4_9AGAR|nr:hypothetical protein EV421DRAFT_58395 [Armillaria borealis]